MLYAFVVETAISKVKRGERCERSEGAQSFVV